MKNEELKNLEIVYTLVVSPQSRTHIIFLPHLVPSNVACAILGFMLAALLVSRFDFVASGLGMQKVLQGVCYVRIGLLFFGILTICWSGSFQVSNKEDKVVHAYVRPSTKQGARLTGL
jgi:hypothetical protein